jgi:hypothetical protein
VVTRVVVAKNQALTGIHVLVNIGEAVYPLFGIDELANVEHRAVYKE